MPKTSFRVNSIESLTDRINKITEAIYYYNEGVSFSWIANATGLSRSNIYRIIEDNPEYIRVNRKKTKAQILEESIEEDCKNITLNDVIEDYKSASTKKVYDLSELESDDEVGDDDED